MSLNSMNARLQYWGGNALGRNVKSKERSFKAALKDDYNSRLIETPIGEAVWCLINNNLLKPDYDRKIISVAKEVGLKAGDTIRCLDDDSHWMIYLPDLAELAYLKSEIIRCRYALNINDKEYWVYFQGPTETTIQWYQKNHVEFNEPNFSGTVYIRNTPETVDYFHRFTKIKIAEQTWEVQVVDKVTVPGIIELKIQEYYENSYSELPDVIATDEPHQIIGHTLVPQDSEIGYTIAEDIFDDDWTWTVEGNPRVKIQSVDNSGRICKVKVHQGAIGGFTVRCGNRISGYSLDVKINATWDNIEGPVEVSPYSKVQYHCDTIGHFWIENSKVARVLEESGQDCTVEILSGKKARFSLRFEDNNKNRKQLDIQVVSL